MERHRKTDVSTPMALHISLTMNRMITHSSFKTVVSSTSLNIISLNQPFSSSRTHSDPHKNGVGRDLPMRTVGNLQSS